MAINKSDVALFLPEGVGDNPDDGGKQTGTELVSGDVNALFADIGPNDQVRGRVAIRTLFGAVKAANADLFLNSGWALTQDAAAENISTLLFDTGNHYAVRSEIQNDIERYVLKSQLSALRPRGTQSAGQKNLIVYADKKTDAPEVGEVLMLEYNSVEQYVKVLDVDVISASYTYIDAQGAYQKYNAYEMTLRLSQELVQDFPASDPKPVVSNSTQIFNTQGNPGAKYYGIKALAADAVVGDSSVSVDSIFQPLVPASTTEKAYVDQTPGIVQKMVQATATATKTRSLGTLTGAQFLTLPTAWVPGTLTLTVAGSTYDEAGGSLRLLSGSNYLSDITISASDGTLGFTVSGSRSVSVSYIAGVAVELTPYTDSVLITDGNRQLTYTFQVAPNPSPGTLRIDWSYLGKWYSMIDDGTGTLTGPSASGAINYDTASGSFTLPSEPDLNSQIIYTWAQTPYSVANVGARTAWFEIALDDQPMTGTLDLAWSRSGTNYTATADSSDVLSGGAGSSAGSILTFTPSVLPSGDLTINYDKLNTAILTASVAVAEQSGGSIVLDVSQTNIVAGSFSFELDLTYTQSTLTGGTLYESRMGSTERFVSNAQGQLKANSMGGAVVGTVDHAAGTITIDADLFTRSVIDYTKLNTVLGGYQQSRVDKLMRVESQTTTISYRSTSAGIPVTKTIAHADLVLKINVADDSVVPGSVVLTLDGTELIDRGDGVLYRSFNLTTAAGLSTGTIDTVNGIAEINYGLISSVVDSLSGSLDAAAIGVGAAVAVTSVVFRTIAAPLRSSGLQFLARRSTDGALMRAVSDNDGVITGSFDDANTITELPQPGVSNGYVIPFVPASTGAGSASGNVDSIAGVVEITFTQPVILSTLTYNAVVYSTVPQNPERLGLNPVRLPTNGQVPAFQDGYLALIHHTGTVSVASPTAGAVIDCGRTDLAVVVVKDSLGALLAYDQYTVDLATGLVTLADPFNAIDAGGNSLTLPLVVYHRIQDRAVITSALLTGELQLGLQLTHDYPAGESYISAMVETGDLQARVKNIFYQKVDVAGVFADELSGDASTASYDDLNYPILVDSRGAVKERWKLKFTSTTGYQCISEQRGVIGTGSTAVDFSPINPMTGTPYFTIRAAGFGEGWVTSNLIAFATDPCSAPVAIIRTVIPSNTPVADGKVVIEFLGAAD